jgi:TPR repeat protein
MSNELSSPDQPALPHNFANSDDEIDHEMQRLADENNPEAQFSYACWLRDHPNKDEFQLKSAHYLRMAAMGDHPKAAHYLGLLLRDESESESNIEESLDFLRKSALSGDRESEYEFARLLFRVKHERELALQSAKEAADQGHIDSAYCYSVLLASSDNPESVREEMIFYLRFAADFGHPEAGKLLWLFLGNDFGFDSLKFAAIGGDVNSQCNIADHF